MLDKVIEFSLKNRFVILLVTALLIVFGTRAAIHLPLDAFPDTTPIQVQVNTVAPALSPEEVERQITFPVELALGGLKGLSEVRSISKFGLSQVVASFEDGTDIYFARQQVNERLGQAELPPGIPRPEMGPVATGLGEVYHYLITSDTLDLTELRSLHDWVIRPRLRRVPGVAEVNAWGGYEKQFEVSVDPARLAQYQLTLDDVIRALQEGNENVGGGQVERAGQSSLLQGVGITRTAEEVSGIVITAFKGVPIRVRDVAQVGIGHAIRRGGVTAHGKGEAVLGLAFMRMGENSREVTKGLDEAMEDVRRGLPSEVNVEVIYARTELVEKVLKTIERNLAEGAILVVAVLFAFLGNLRAGLIVASAIPLSMLFAVTLMERIGIAGSLMSLGAIDFGLVVDSSVVMVENCVRRLAHDRTGRSKLAIIRDAASEVRKPTLFGELIIMIVYLPILTLEGVEGKLFRPMALTVIFALVGSMVLSLTLMPALASIGLPRRISEKETLIDRFAHRLFGPLLRVGLSHPWTTLVLVGTLTVVTTIMGMKLGAEFVPKLNEGTIVINTVRLAGVSLDESLDYGTHIESLLKQEFPSEIQAVWTRTGTPEVATDPMGLEVSDIFVTLTPRGRWRRAQDQQHLIKEMSEVVEALPGMKASFSQPIEMRINEMAAGIRADLGIKLYGDDFDALKAKAEEIERVVRAVPGAADVSVEQFTGQPVIRIEVDQEAISRYGVRVHQVLQAVSAVGGVVVGEIREPVRRFPLVVRLPSEFRDDPAALEGILIPTTSGERLPLTKLARIVSDTGPSTIQRDWGKRRVVIQANVRGRDLGSFVTDAQSRVGKLDLSGFMLEWGGQFDHLIRAERRLYLVVPLALALILSLLYLTFRSVRDALMIFSGVIFARVGGVVGLFVMGLPFTISAGVGFIALAGASMLEGLILVSAIRDRMAHGVPKREAIEQARISRLRPVLMTGTVAALGFVPMMLSTGVGAEVQKPLATVVVFGMAFDTFLTMLVLPVLYLLFGKGPEIEADADGSLWGTNGTTSDHRADGPLTKNAFERAREPVSTQQGG